MKTYNTDHDVEIVSYSAPISTDGAKHGDVMPHKHVVNGLYKYYSVGGHPEKFIQVYLDRSMILDLASHISKIESEVHDEEYYDIPF